MNSLKLDLEPFEMDTGNDAFSEVKTNRCSQSNSELDLDAFEVEGDDLAWEEGGRRPQRRSTWPAGRRPRPLHSRQTSIPWPHKSTRQPQPPEYLRRPTWSRRRRRPFIVREPSAPCICPAHGREFVRWVQSSLNQIFNLRLRVHGVMDRATRAALRRFQEELGLPGDGIVGPETEKALVEARARRAGGADSLSSAWEDLEALDLDLTDVEWEGEVNRTSREYIRWVQSSLNRIMGLRLAVDGINGPKTQSAIRSFQAQKGLSVDGIVGPITESALVAAGAGRPPGGSSSYIPAPPSARPPATTPTGPLAFITIESDVIMNPELDRVVRELEAYFRNANLKVTLTSAIRTAEEQLRIIKNAAIKYGLDQKYPSINTATVNDVQSWVKTWDELLQVKTYIVMPPKPVTSIITGKRYDISPHMKGQAFDLSGADLDRIASVAQTYCQQGGALSQILVERTNNAVHIGIGSRGTCNISST
jgi:peptidoglycan hydrolase-like protein with peptidoglycan-binding domain